MLESIGLYIKQVRKNKGITLAKLSEETKLSIAYLSKMERGLNDLTVTNLNIICKTLGLDIATLLSHNNESHTIIRANEREVILEDEYMKVASVCNPNTTNLHFTCTEYKKSNMQIKEFAHDFDEIGVVLSGELDAMVDGVSHILYAGDSIHIKANSMRFMRNVGDKPCVTYWIHMPKEE